MTQTHVPSTTARFFARSIDAVVALVFVGPALGLWGWGVVFADVIVPWNLVLYVAAVLVAVEALPVWLLGTTAGKWVFSMRVVDARNGGIPSGWSALLRALTCRFSFFFGYGLYAMMWFKSDRTQPADWVAGTRVVSEKPRVGPVLRRPLMALVGGGILAIASWQAAVWLMSGITWSRAGVIF